jgi:predicted DNA-binding transcriptional regulator AlpA
MERSEMRNGADALPPGAAIPIAGLRTSRQGAGGVDFAALVQDVSLVANVPPAALPALLARAAAEAALVNVEAGRIAALQGALAARLVGEDTAASTATEKLLNVREAADLLRVSVDWLYHHAKTLPFTRHVGAHALRFDRAGIARWLAGRRRG